MGRIEYNAARPPIGVDDDTPAHLKIVIATKLRRQESFMMTWLADTTTADGRLTIWVHPSIPLIIAFDDAVMPSVDPQRVTRMMDQLNTRGELILDQLSH